MEYMLYTLLALLRGILFPDFSTLTSVLVIHVLGPTLFACIGLCFAPKQRFRPDLLYFKNALGFLLLAEGIGLGVYAQSGGLPYLFGEDFTPALILASMVVQVVVFFAVIFAGSKFKYAPAP